MFRCNVSESIEREVAIPDCSSAAFLQVLRSLYMDGFSVSIDDVVDVWVLARDIYQLEGLKKFSCLGSMERYLCEEK